MPLDAHRLRQLLTAGDLRALFIEVLGWDRHNSTLQVVVGDSVYPLVSVAHKRGMVAYECTTPAGREMANHAMRRKIEQQVAKTAHEHLIVFTDAQSDTMVWQWVKREPGKPTACREHTFHRSQPGDALLQKLGAITFTIEEEERLSLTDVTRRARAGFDVERITKRFYERFQKEHSAFLQFISGVADRADREWYGSVMLNRLMFVYFIQRKGFLDGDTNYLRNRLNRLRSEHGTDKFYSFYRYFLLRLFHEGLGGDKRTQDLEQLVGRIPYLNGGLFDVHELERTDRYGEQIQIADEAFERVFDYFDQYQWHLDERPLRSDNEINPDVLGYIFEKYINQKQMGAYYTKEDITEYIGKNTVLPFLLRSARTACNVAFENPKGPTVWDLLTASPDRYIFDAVRHGVGEPIPSEIGADLSPTYGNEAIRKKRDAERARNLRRVAGSAHALPGETWAEVIARRERFEVLRARVASGTIRDVGEFVSLNLDIRQFAQDAIENCEGPDLLRAFWNAIERVTVLDPTCGSGAFLFAALNVLEPLYEACLDRMEAFVSDLDRDPAAPRPDRLSDFRRILKRVDTHPNRRYFVLKSIILNNLFGVDIMDEAVEICKLRLFLKLAAQVEPDATKRNLGIEPLPDIDFNIRAGNTLVGYATLAEVTRALSKQLDFDKAAEKIAEKAAELQKTADAFRAWQVEDSGAPPIEHKRQIRARLAALDEELNRHLAGAYGIDSSKVGAYTRWLKAHQPFHWFVEFYGIMRDGGFDVIIGNPPYVEIPKEWSRPLLRSTFKTPLEKWSRDEDLYTLVVERSLGLLKKELGRCGLILPLSIAFSTKRSFVVLRERLAVEEGLWHWSHFDRIPSALFGNEVRTRCTIALLSRDTRSSGVTGATTSLQRWNADRRDSLFAELHYALLKVDISAGIPKVDSQLQADVLKQLAEAKAPLVTELTKPIAFDVLADAAPEFPQPCVYVGGTAYNWFPAWRDIPETTNVLGEPSLPARTAGYRFSTEEQADVVFALLCSSLGYWWWAVASDGFNLKKWLLDRFPVSQAMIPPGSRKQLARLGAQLRAELKRNYVFKDNKGRIGNYLLPACGDEVAAIDGFLGASVAILSTEFFEDIRAFNAGFSRAELDELAGDGE